MTPYETAHHSAAIVHRAARGVLIVTGADRAAFLHGLLTNDVKSLVRGRGCEAAWLTPQGRMIAGMRVLALEDRIVLEVPASDAPALAGRLEQLVFAEDVQVRDASHEMVSVGVVGPAAPELVAAVLAVAAGLASAPPSSTALAAWVAHQNAVFPTAGGAVLAVRDDGLGLPEYDLYATPPEIGHLGDVMRRRGAIELDTGTLETLRIEAGRPLFGVDMDAETIPLEAGIEDRAISFTKGCYVGQEVIVRVTTRGQGRVVRKLVGLVLDGSRVPDRGEPLWAGDREIGRVTSATWSAALGRPIALGYVHRDFIEPSTRIGVGRDTRDAATVTALPFV